jgi:hypothetical protein
MNQRRRMLRDLAKDMREHIEIETRDNIERGMPPEEARYAALRKFGNTVHVQEEVREIWGWTWLERFAQDVRYGLRTLWRAKWVSVAAVATLALRALAPILRCSAWFTPFCSARCRFPSPIGS